MLEVELVLVVVAEEVVLEVVDSVDELDVVDEVLVVV